AGSTVTTTVCEPDVANQPPKYQWNDTLSPACPLIVDESSATPSTANCTVYRSELERPLIVHWASTKTCSPTTGAVIGRSEASTSWAPVIDRLPVISDRPSRASSTGRARRALRDRPRFASRPAIPTVSNGMVVGLPG